MLGAEMFEKILIRLPNWVGDVVMATPAVRAVRDRWPDAEVTALCMPSGEKILRGSPRIDRFEVYDRRGRDRGPFGMHGVIRRLRGHGYDLAIAMPNSFSSAWIHRRARIPRRLGTAYGKRGWLLTDRFRPDMEGNRRTPRSMVEHYADLLTTIGVSRGDESLELFETEEGRKTAHDTLSFLGVEEGDRVVAINPGASFGVTKIWPVERMAEVADRLQEEHGLKPLLVGGPGEEMLLAELERKMRTPAISTEHEILDLDALKSAVRRCSLMITTDTGPRHFAVAFDVPVVVIMGPTDPRYTETNLDRTTVIRVEDLECSPCHLKTCPLTHHRCMTWIEPDQVVSAAADLLRRFPPDVPGD
jgi:heptosyltransferase-2